MKIKTSDLIGPALDWAVAKCEGRDYHSHGCTYATDGSGKVWAAGTCPSEDCHSTDWAQGGPIVERMLKDGLLVHALPETSRWIASVDKQSRFTHSPTLLIAAMRCYVASELGDEVEVPDELLEK